MIEFYYGVRKTPFSEIDQVLKATRERKTTSSTVVLSLLSGLVLKIKDGFTTHRKAEGF